ncbi:uncharacterized protein LOC106659706 [Trichogramma pretiosum]|uniref:uncharacterized protein LOC106659706 n=1 Tax=Trichogramma pretiosum TaxID=7493 RepID=UPI000C71C194|nr:uncharacterized protein LOC106659706 [Trichogramma pretiosum]
MNVSKSNMQKSAVKKSIKKKRKQFIKKFMNNSNWHDEDLLAFIVDEFDGDAENINWILKTVLETERWNYRLVEVLMENGAELQVLNDLGQTAIHLAAKKKNWSLSNILFNYSGNENLSDNQGFTYLHAACMTSNVTVVQKFIDEGVDVNLIFFDNGIVKTPLSLAIEDQDADIAKLLLNNGADLKLVDDNWDKSPLRCLKRVYEHCGYYELEPLQVIGNHFLSNLVKHTTDKDELENLGDDEGFTYLHAACMYGKIEIVQKFIDQRIDLDLIWYSSCGTNESPLTLATKFEQVEIMKVLLKHGANPSISLLRKNVLHVFFHSFNFDSELLELLIDYKCDVNARDHENHTPLALCLDNILNMNDMDWNDESTELMKTGHKNLEILLQNNADPNQVLDDGQTCLHLVVSSSRCGPIDYDTDVYLPDLYENLMYKCLEMVKVLLKYGANPNVIDNEGNSPLYLAVLQYNYHVVKVLLQHGADVQSVDLSKKPIEYNQSSDYLDQVFSFLSILDLLKSKGHELNRPSALAILKLLIDPDRCDECHLPNSKFETRLKLGFLTHIRVFLKNIPSNSLERYLCSDVLEKYLEIVQQGKMYITEEMKDCLKQWPHTTRNDQAKNDYFAAISEQIEYVKHLMIKDGVSLLDVCATSPEKGYYLLKDSDFWTFFYSNEKEFSTISNVIKGYIIQCLMRKLFVDIGFEYIILLTQGNLPLLCCEKLIQYLNNEDILLDKINRFCSIDSEATLKFESMNVSKSNMQESTVKKSIEKKRKQFITKFMENRNWHDEDLLAFIVDEFDGDAENINWILKTVLETERWNYRLVEVLMENGAELQVLNDLGQTAIHLVVKKKNWSLSKILFDYSGNENLSDNQGFTYLHAACMTSNVTVVQKFIDQGVDVNLIFFDDGLAKTPLSLAIEKSDAVTAKLLLNNGADLKLVDDNWCEAPLRCLKRVYEHCSYYELEPMQVIGNHFVSNLVKHTTGKDELENLGDDEGFTYLHAACMYGNIEIVQQFIDQKIDLDLIWYSSCGTNESPLTLATKFKEVEIIKVLLEHGANPSISLLRKNLLHVFFHSFNSDSELLELLIDYKCDVNERNHENSTPIMLCLDNILDMSYIDWIDEPTELMKIGHKNLEILLQNNADPNQVLDDGQTCLHLVSHCGPIDYDPGVCLPDLYKNLMYNCLEMVKLLLKYGANPNVIDKEGNSPLYLAVLQYNYDVVKVLLQHGADVQSVDLSKKSLEYNNYKDYLDQVFSLLSILDLLKSKGHKMIGSSDLTILKFLIDPGFDDEDYKSYTFEATLKFGSLTQIRALLNKISSDSPDLHLYSNDLQNHLEIIQKGKMYITEEMKDCLIQWSDTYPIEQVEDFYAKISEQIEYVKNLMIKDGVSLLDVCATSPENGYYLLQNSEFMTVFDLNRKEFSSISRTIKGYIIKCCMRKLFVDIGLEYLILLMQGNLPVLFCEQVIQYMSNEDILSMCISVDEFEN